MSLSVAFAVRQRYSLEEPLGTRVAVSDAVAIADIVKVAQREHYHDAVAVQSSDWRRRRHPWRAAVSTLPCKQPMEPAHRHTARGVQQVRRLLPLYLSSCDFPPSLTNSALCCSCTCCDSATMISSIGTTVNLHPDFGAGLWDGGPIGIPFNIVDSGTPRVSAGTGDFDYYDESDLGEYPMPANPVFEYASDRHVLMVDSDSCMLYELFNAAIDADGTWHAGSGAKFDLRSNALRPAG